MQYLYTYLWLSLLFCLVWVILYVSFSSERTLLWSYSLSLAPFGVVADMLYTIDWWTPVTITGTRLGIEALIGGFGIVGVACVSGKVFHRRSTIAVQWNRRSALSLAGIFAGMTVVSFGAFYVFSLNSLLCTLLAQWCVILPILLIKPVWIRYAISYALSLTVIASVVYLLLSLLYPGWIEEFYHFANTPNVVIGTLPLDDLIFYLSTGAFFGILPRWIHCADVPQV